MKKELLIYGALMAGLVLVLKYLEYRFLLRDLALEAYMGIIAAVFTGLGLWAGRKLRSPSKSAENNPEKTTSYAQPLEDLLAKYQISRREWEVLSLIAQGLSNQEIADKLFVSVSTIKTHTSNLFSKLDVQRRTQAIQKAKQVGLLTEKPVEK